MPVRTLMFGKWMMDCISPHPPPLQKKTKNSQKPEKLWRKNILHFQNTTYRLCCWCLLLPKTPSNDKKQRVSRNKIPKEHFLDWPSFSIKWPMTDVSSGDLSWVNYMESERRGGEFLDEWWRRIVVSTEIDVYFVLWWFFLSCQTKCIRNSNIFSAPNTDQRENQKKKTTAGGEKTSTETPSFFGG